MYSHTFHQFTSPLTAFLNMQSIRSYRLSSSEESSSDESQMPELFQLPAPSKKLCTSREHIALQAETNRASPHHLQFKEAPIDDTEPGEQQEEQAEKANRRKESKNQNT